MLKFFFNSSGSNLLLSHLGRAYNFQTYLLRTIIQPVMTYEQYCKSRAIEFSVDIYSGSYGL
jgi:hypothetical protein